MIKEDLRKIGIQVDVTALDLPALRERIGTGVYDAIYFGILASDRDPAVNLDFWLSRGAFHVWNPGQTTPATPWEKEIDALMLKNTAATDQAERKRLFDQVQKILAAEQPVMHFAAAATIVATSTRVLNVQPALLRHRSCGRPTRWLSGTEPDTSAQRTANRANPSARRVDAVKLSARMATQTLLRFLIQRTASAVVLVWLAASGMLGLMRLSAGDFAGVMAQPGASSEVIDQERARLGLDRSFGRYYAAWLGRAVRLISAPRISSAGRSHHW